MQSRVEGKRFLEVSCCRGLRPQGRHPMGRRGDPWRPLYAAETVTRVPAETEARRLTSPIAFAQMLQGSPSGSRPAPRSACVRSRRRWRGHRANRRFRPLPPRRARQAPGSPRPEFRSRPLPPIATRRLQSGDVSRSRPRSASARAPPRARWIRTRTLFCAYPTPSWPHRSDVLLLTQYRVIVESSRNPTLSENRNVISVLRKRSIPQQFAWKDRGISLSNSVAKST